MAITHVVLHGPLAKEFGKDWHLDISSPAEAIRAIECNRPGFRQRFLDLDKKGLVFRVSVRSREASTDLGEEDLHHPLPESARIDIVPIARGASSGVRFIIGAVLFVVGVIVTGMSFGTAGPVGYSLMSLGMSLMIGSVVQWLTPVPDKKKMEEDQTRSFSMSGPVNTVEQGLPVPVIYGEVLAGAHVISASILTEELIVGGDPAVTIVGTKEYACAYQPVYTSVFSGTTYSAEPCTNRFKLLPRVAGMVAPIQYEWSTSNSSGAWVLEDGGGTSDHITLSCSGNSETTFGIDVSVTATDKYGTSRSTTVHLSSVHYAYVEPPAQNYAG